MVMDLSYVRNPDCFLLCFQAVQILGRHTPVVEHAITDIMAVDVLELLQGLDSKPLARWVMAGV